MTRLLTGWFVLTIVAVAGCGGGGGSSFDSGPFQATVSKFSVSGNDTAVNGREQIVAGINTGIFTIGFSAPTESSGDASIWISDREDLSATNLEQKIADITCTFYPFCTFNVKMNCSFSMANLVNCSLVSGGSSTVETTFPVADISLLMVGSQTDLFIVVNTKGNGTTTAHGSVPVTFRYN